MVEISEKVWELPAFLCTHPKGCKCGNCSDCVSEKENPAEKAREDPIEKAKENNRRIIRQVWDSNVGTTMQIRLMMAHVPDIWDFAELVLNKFSEDERRIEQVSDHSDKQYRKLLSKSKPGFVDFWKREQPTPEWYQRNDAIKLAQRAYSESKERILKQIEEKIQELPTYEPNWVTLLPSMSEKTKEQHLLINCSDVLRILQEQDTLNA